MPAPAASYSASATPARMPAPASTRTSAPSARIFFTLSGVAATRGSVSSASAGMAIFMLPPGPRSDCTDAQAVPMRRPAAARGHVWNSGEENGHGQENDGDHHQGAFHQSDEKPIGALALGEIIAGLIRGFDPSVVGHRVLPIRGETIGFRLAQLPSEGNAALPVPEGLLGGAANHPARRSCRRGEPGLGGRPCLP